MNNDYQKLYIKEIKRDVDKNKIQIVLGAILSGIGALGLIVFTDDNLKAVNSNNLLKYGQYLLIKYGLVKFGISSVAVLSGSLFVISGIKKYLSNKKILDNYEILNSKKVK